LEGKGYSVLRVQIEVHKDRDQKSAEQGAQVAQV